MELSERKKSILAVVVDEYIKTAEPVGSKKVAELSNLGCSSATIRNELAELVSLGLLEQPHTSAGRIPTAKGYRMYVNELMDSHRLSLEEAEQINRNLTAQVIELDNMLKDVGNLASELTNYPALMTASAKPTTILRFDLIYIDANTFIIVLLLSDNTVKNKLVKLPISVGQEMMQRLSSVFNANFTNLTCDEISPMSIMAAERATDDSMGLVSVISAFAIETLARASTSDTFITGTNRLLSQPEYRDPIKAADLINYLQNEDNIINIPNKTADSGADIHVLIGPENLAAELAESSVICATYDAGDNTRGLIGVVGPTRMDYSAVAAKLEIIATVLSKKLGGGRLPPRGMDTKLIIKGDIGEVVDEQEE